MSARVFAASVLAVFVFSTAAAAADLYGQYGETYDERYAEGDRYGPPGDYGSDRYGRSHDYDERDYAGGYRDGYGGDVYEDEAYRGSVKDGYPIPEPPPRFSERTEGPHAGGCIPRWQIRHKLRAEGWIDIRRLERGGDLAIVRARREDSGRVFRLGVDRCTGDIVHARPQRLREFGAYSPRPWERTPRY